MESYGADTRPPIDRCLSDVGSCEVYVGIVAWRYGSSPPAQRQSFTHLEYEEAHRLCKQILLFHLHEDAAWPTRHVDQSQTEVRALREMQSRDHIVDYFSTIEQLVRGVRQALDRLYGETAASVPALLPYIADRHAQKERLAVAARRRELDCSPSLIILHGAVGQAHHKFVEHMQEQLLARCMAVAGPIHMAAVALRSTEFDDSDTVTRRIAGACCLDPTIDVGTLSRQLHDFGSVTILRFPLEVELRRGRPQAHRLLQLVNYFAEWPQRRPMRVLPVISVQYREPRGWSGRFSWTTSGARSRLLEEIEAAAASAVAPTVVLPELSNIEQVEAEVWADQAEVRRVLNACDPVPEIRRIFSTYERSAKERGMPMEKLAAALNQLLQQELLQRRNNPLVGSRTA
jgi:hypothetical protein